MHKISLTLHRVTQNPSYRYIMGKMVVFLRMQLGSCPTTYGPACQLGRVHCRGVPVSLCDDEALASKISTHLQHATGVGMQLPSMCLWWLNKTLVKQEEKFRKC